ncbi:hypothetical protein [Limobrevibacterium gyesilva]|uniref:Uncharacterized protein n=1 Tax=Limobrevibacterium gyesilva TaxID=2991712 RepID=A0AA42CGK2_9PROT|nr:hypothetical protein [Limobrevibacterium gyesilva]MCW3473930.1 hypothetical protein [Limobrevibacterium gyesilva]
MAEARALILRGRSRGLWVMLAERYGSGDCPECRGSGNIAIPGGVLPIRRAVATGANMERGEE